MCASEGNAPGPDTEHHPAPCQVVEKHHPVGHDERVVVGQRDHPGSELDPLCTLGCRSDEDVGSGNRLVAVGVVLSDPRLVVAELIEPVDQLEIAVDRQRRVVRRIVEGPDERPESHWLIHRLQLLRVPSHTVWPGGGPGDSIQHVEVLSNGAWSLPGMMCLVNSQI